MITAELPKYRRIEVAQAAQISSIEKFEIDSPEALVSEDKKVSDEKESNKGLMDKAKDLLKGESKSKTPGKNIEIKKEKMVRLHFNETSFKVEMTSGKAKSIKASPGRFYVLSSDGKESTRSAEFFLRNYSSMGV